MKGKKILTAVILFFAVFMLIAKTEAVTYGAIEALTMCVKSVIPALFPFFVLTGLMVNCGIVVLLGKVLSPVSKRLFKTSGVGAVAFVIGILCGYPTGAKVISELYTKGKLTKNESERLLAFCNNSGPLFIIGAVGAEMLGNKNIGILLYCIHVTSAVITGVVLSLFAKKEKTSGSVEMEAVSFAEAFTGSVESAVKSILNVCGYVVFFGCFLAVASAYIPNEFVKSLAEVTTGAKNIISSTSDNEQMLTLLSGTIGFGGLCVYFQVRGAVERTKLSTAYYIFGKILQMTISMLIMKIYLYANGSIAVFVPVSKPQVTFGVSYVVLFVFLLCTVFLLKHLTKKS